MPWSAKVNRLADRVLGAGISAFRLSMVRGMLNFRLFISFATLILAKRAKM